MLRKCYVLLNWGIFESVDGPPKRRAELLMHDTIAQKSQGALLTHGYFRGGYMRQYRYRTLLTELIRKDFLVVQQSRAHALAVYANQAVSLAKRGDTRSRQQLAFFLLDNYMVDKAFDEFPERFRSLNGNYCAVSQLRERRAKDSGKLFFVELRNRMNSPTHLGDDTERGPERFFLPQPQLESHRDREIPKHWQMIFDRWASKYKTDEFFTYWKMRHAVMRFRGYRNVPHPADVSPLWTDQEEEAFQQSMAWIPTQDAASASLEDTSVVQGQRHGIHGSDTPARLS